MSKPIRLIAIVLMCAVLLPAAGSPFLSASAAPLATAPSLGAAASFAVLAGSAVTNTGSSTCHRRPGCLAWYRGHGLWAPGPSDSETIYTGTDAAVQAQRMSRLRTMI